METGLSLILLLVLAGCGVGTPLPIAPVPPPVSGPVSGGPPPVSSGPAAVSCGAPVSAGTPVGGGSAGGTGSFAGMAFSVVSEAGAQALAGATIQVCAAGTNGNGSTPTALLSSALMTDAKGSVAIPAGYSCPAGSSLLYVVSRGGTPGTALSANTNAVLMAALGRCDGMSAGSKIVVNEVTTVAATFALAQFTSVAGAIGATSTNGVGIANAFQTAATLADTASGSSPGTLLPGNAASPAARVNSLANLLNECAGSAAACDGLYGATTVGGATSGGMKPGNTLDAAFQVARHPASNVATLYAESAKSAAYTPVLTSVPTDWTMFISYRGGGMSEPTSLGVDSAGAVWVANYFNVASKFSNLGAPMFAQGVTGSGLNNSYGLAIDLRDDAWVANELPAQGSGSGSISVLTSAGASRAGAAGFTGGGLNYPISVAIDPNQTVWVVNYGNSTVTVLDGSGASLSGPSGFQSPLFSFPVAVAVDLNHFGWLANQSDTTVTKVAPDGSSFTNYDCCSGASGVAIDQGNNVWVANYHGSSVSLISSAGAVISKGTYTGAGSLKQPQGIVVDGSGNVWVANFLAPYLTELAGINAAEPGASLTPAAGLGADANLLEAYALALDASGNIWVTSKASDTLTKFIGLATPVKTPLSGLPKLP